MHTIISIAAVMAIADTQTLDNCVEYCNLLKSDQLRPFWRPDCVCFMEYQENNYRPNKPTKLKRQPSLDESAVYLEPSNEYPYYMPSFVDYPFYIVNPTYQEQSLKNSDNRKPRKLVMSTAERVKKLNNSLKKRKPDDLTVRTININSENLPLYLDIDIYKNNDISNNRKKYNLNKIEMTEDDLMECIDLHILVYSRKSDQNVPDLKTILLDKSKINKYKGLSDSDLMIEIQSKCHQPTNVVNERLQEIKNSWTKKFQLGPKSNTEEYSEYLTKDQNRRKNMDFFEFAKTDTSANSVKKIKLENRILQPTKESADKVSLLQKNSNAMDYLTSNSDSNNKIHNKNLTTDLSAVDKPFVTVNSYTDTRTNQADSSAKEIIINVYKGFQKDLVSNSSSNVLDRTLESTTRANTDIYSKLLAQNTTETHIIKLQSDYNSSSESLHSNQQTQLFDKDIKIPRIDTKEIKNSTIITSINGTELIPNNDFVKTISSKSQNKTKANLEGISVEKSTNVQEVSFNIFSGDTTINPADKSIHAKSEKDNFYSKDDKNTDKLYSGEKNKAEIEFNGDVSALTDYNNSSTNITHTTKLVKNISLLPYKLNEYYKNQNASIESRHFNKSQISDRNNSIPRQTPVTFFSHNFNTSRVIVDISDTILKNATRTGNDNLSNQNVSLDSKIKTDSKKNITEIKTGGLRYTTDQVNTEPLTSYDLVKQTKLDIKEEIVYKKKDASLTQISYFLEGDELITDEISSTEDAISTTVSSINQHNTTDVLEDFPLFNNSVNMKTQYKENYVGYSKSHDLTTKSPIFTDFYTNRNINILPGTISTTSSLENKMSLGTQKPKTPSPNIHNTTLISSNVSELSRFPKYSKTIKEIYNASNPSHKHELENPSYKINNSTDSLSENYTTPSKENISIQSFIDSASKDIVGELYFLFDDKQVPVQFVQNKNGKIKLGVDGMTLCDKITNGNYSVLIKALCDCSESRNCMSDS